MEYVIESKSLKNLFAFLVFDFNTPLDVSTNDCKRYFLIQKNKQFAEATGICLFMKLCTILDDVNKYQEICNLILFAFTSVISKGCFQIMRVLIVVVLMKRSDTVTDWNKKSL